MREWIYGNIEYLPPPDDSGKRAFHPIMSEVLIDTTDTKSNGPEKNDYNIELLDNVYDPNNPNYYNGMYYTYGAGNGYWKAYPGVKAGETYGVTTFSVISTPTFDTPHPYYEFKIDKNKFGIKNPFGLGFIIVDTHVVSKNNGGISYVAAFPANDFGQNMPNILFSPNLWADAYFSEASTSQTMISSLTSKSSATPPIPSSTTSSTATTSIAGAAFVSLQTLLEMLGGASVAGISALGLYRYYRRKRN